MDVCRSSKGREAPSPIWLLRSVDVRQGDPDDWVRQSNDMNSQHNVVLAVHLEESEVLDFRQKRRYVCKPEQEASLIERFCSRTRRFPYSRQFVSVAVYRPEEKPCNSRANIYGDSGALRKNQYVILKPELVLDRIEVVACDDFLQVATDIATRWKNRHLYDAKMRQIRDLRQLTPEQKLEALVWATRNRNTHGYAEARLSGSLLYEDVGSWETCD